VRARESRIAEETVSAIDFFGRMIGAIEDGNWYYAGEKLSQLVSTLNSLDAQLGLAVPGGRDVAAYVAEHSQEYRVGRALYGSRPADTTPTGSTVAVADPSTTEPRARQQAAAWHLAHTLLRPLPLMTWELSSHADDTALEGRPDDEHAPAQQADAVRQWAQALNLPDPVAEQAPELPGYMFESQGTRHGVTVRVRVYLAELPADGGQ
jgi:hypothetical protein